MRQACRWSGSITVRRSGCISLGLIAYTVGNSLFRIRGGINARTRRRSQVEVNSIIATYGNSHAIQKMRDDYMPPLNNRTLFQRDDRICLYCGEPFRQEAACRAIM